MKKLYLLALLSLIYFSFFGQNTYSADEIIQAGIEFYKEKSYEEAIESYRRINLSDPKYLLAQYEIVNTLLVQRELEEALILSTALYNDKKHLEFPDLLVIHGVALSESDKLEEAMQVFDEGLKSNPESTHLLINKAAVLHKQNKKQEVLDLYKKIIKIDPSHTSALYYLGNLALEDGKIVEGSLALMTYLMLEPSTVNAQNALLTLNKKYHQNFANTPELKYSEKGDDFKKLEELLNAQVQYHKDYPLKIGIDDVVTRNMQAIIDYFENHEIKDGYFENQFGKYIKEIAISGNTKNYLYVSLLTVSSNFEREYKRNEREIKDYIDNYLSEIVDKFLIGYRNTQRYRVFRENEEVVFIPLNGKDEFEGKGIVETYTGVKKADFLYEDKELNGVKNYYKSNGDLTFSETYLDGEVTGPVKKYDHNAKLILEANSKNGKAHGEYVSYYPTSGISCNGNYIDDNYNGELVCYYPDGSKKIQSNYKNGMLEGEYKRYNEIGQLILSANYVNNEVEGEYLEYFDDGTLKIEGKYENGKLLHYKTYYPNKQLKTLITYKNYKLASSVSYSYNGQLLEKEIYDSNENLTSIESYNENNHKYQTHFFRNGKYISSEFEFSDGELEKNKDRTIYQNFNTFGHLISEGIFDKNKPVGEWKYYSNIGKLRTKVTFDNEGNYVKEESFLANGDRDYKVMFKNNMYYGIYEDYLNDKIKYTQYYDESGLNGPEVVYYDSGKIYSNAFYEENDLEYDSYVYTQAGKIYRKNIMSEGVVVSSTYYMLEEPFTFDYVNKNGSYTIKETSSISKMIELKNGQLHGESVKKAGDLILNVENYVNNRLHGKQIYNAPTGKIMFESEFISGKRHGATNTYDDLGNLKTSSNYVWNKEHGVQIKYLPGVNKKYEERTFVEDERHGPTTIQGTNGEVLAVFDYYYGTPVSYQITDKTGKLSGKIPFTKEVAKIESYYKNGTKGLEISLENFLYNGDYKLYFDNGNLALHLQYILGWLNGAYTINFESGKPYMQTSFKNGKQEGTTIYYEANGNKIIEIQYVEDELHGAYKIYENNEVKNTYIFDSDILVTI